MNAKKAGVSGMPAFPVIIIGNRPKAALQSMKSRGRNAADVVKTEFRKKR